MKNNGPICMTEEYWANSHFSIARHYGQIRVNGHIYVIVNKEGKDIFRLSAEAEKAGRSKAIEAGEPADLCRIDFVPLYAKLGRDAFLDVLKEHNYASDKELKAIFKGLIKVKKARGGNGPS